MKIFRLKNLKLVLLGLASALACLLITPVIAATNSPSPAPPNLPQQQSGQSLYQQGRYAEAIAILQQTAQAYQNQGDSLQQAATLSNLALAYQKTGEIESAEQAIAKSLEILQNSNGAGREQVLAETMNIQGSLQLSKGQAETAIATWHQVKQIYDRLNDSSGAIRAQINQAAAMQSLGLYRRALDTLEAVEQDLKNQPDSETKAIGLRSLGDILRLVGDMNQSKIILEQSLAIAKALPSPEAESAALFSLGNWSRTSRLRGEAMKYYQKAAEITPKPTTRVEAQLNYLSLLSEGKQPQRDNALIASLQQGLETLPLSRTAVYARINFANSLLKFGDPPLDIARYLAQGAKDAKTLGDNRAESYALGNLGRLYEQTGQLAEAEKLTTQSLVLAQSMNAPDIAYRWQWQLGRLLRAQNKDKAGAIAAYSQAINTLQALRSDLVAINSDVQFSFRESVEPVYREFVSLLLEKDNTNKNSDKNTPKNNSENIEKARKVIESLQLAELDNFFRAACLNAKSVEIDKIDQKAAIIYPVILPDRLEVIFSFPGQPLTNYATPVTQVELEDTVQNFRQLLVQRTRPRYHEYSTKIYDWLIRPVEEQLAQSEVKTLVFVLDGVLRNVPMAALSDGEKFLAEKYAIALTPGLQLTDSGALKRAQVHILKAGLSEGRQGFSPLPGVATEIQQIGDKIPGETLLNEAFTAANIQEALDSQPFPVVHLATHGKFSSSAEDTFILTWDNKINVNELSDMLKTTGLGNSKAIELLVFSACETATGDKRAALGIAGVAVRAGARSTMATLWSVNDKATSEFMSRFYQELTNPDITKAEALRRAQVAVLENPEYRRHPYYWAPFILVGNWL